ncbi:neural cell adhesion molecule 2-like [Schistocerca nitens]|uniref:neural cell adhesion molecule 2-like n=1 Tax=Schistocerca nitens TaxID=7011 RepID=UPI002119B203|nr:neural cell adhesion molecule 2-like [Schistocerca nitens]
MLLSPLVTQLLGENRPLSAGRQYEVSCQTVGSRPPANVSWWRDTLLLEGARDTTSGDGNVTTSTLSLSPVADDSGRQLCCRAANILLPPPEVSEQLHDCRTLHVRYSPIVDLELGSNINGSAIREGVDVYFECNVRANPWIHKVVWRHNGRQLHSNPSAGTLLSNQTLVLQAVKRQRSGLYTCVASNSEGDTESNAFNLDVKYAPECVHGQQRVWGAARRETVSVPCQVEARPAATLFRWAFNSSAGGPSSTPAAVTTQPGRSVATHTPLSERDYGTLLCWARNELGTQLHPCVFLVVPAGKPDPPRDCRVSSRSTTSLQVSCTRGSDGGLPPQHFTLELLAGRGGRLVANVTSRASPEFTVAGLEPGTTYHLRVYSSNGKGRSDAAAELNVTTLRASQQHRRIDAVSTAPSPTAPLLPPPAWLVVVVVAAVLLLCAAAGVAVARARGCRLRGRRRGAQGDSTGSSSPSGKTPPPIQEDNPDVVPPRKDETELPGQAYKALQQYNIVVEARPVNVDSSAQTVLYSAVNTFPMTEAVVLAPCWPSPGSSDASAPLLAPATATAAPGGPPPGAAPLGSAAASPRLQDAETQTAAPLLRPRACPWHRRRCCRCRLGPAAQGEHRVAEPGAPHALPNTPSYDDTAPEERPRSDSRCGAAAMAGGSPLRQSQVPQIRLALAARPWSDCPSDS